MARYHNFFKASLLALVCAASAFIANAADVKDSTVDCQLPVMVSLSEESGELAGANAGLLVNKIEQAVSIEGFGGTELSHLCLSVSLSELDKQVISGMRPLVTQQLEVFLVLNNILSGVKFGATSFTVSGTGNNEAQALRKALAAINPSNQQLRSFMSDTRKKVFSYYEAHIPSIIQQARVLADRDEYEKALFTLSTVPPCCAGYDAVGDAMLAVWAQYRDRDCSEKLAKATALWSASQTDEAALTVAAYLAAIDRRSSCVDAADALLAEIKDKVGENIARVIAREEEDRAFDKEKQRAAIDMQREELQIRRDEVDALRQLAIAYAQYVLGPVVNNLSQPSPTPNVTINNHGKKE